MTIDKKFLAGVNRFLTESEGPVNPPAGLRMTLTLDRDEFEQWANDEGVLETINFELDDDDSEDDYEFVFETLYSEGKLSILKNGEIIVAKEPVDGIEIDDLIFDRDNTNIVDIYRQNYRQKPVQSGSVLEFQYFCNGATQDWFVNKLIEVDNKSEATDSKPSVSLPAKVEDDENVDLPPAFSRLEGLVNLKNLEAMKVLLNSVIKDAKEEGFEKEDINEYLEDLVHDMFDGKWTWRK